MLGIINFTHSDHLYSAYGDKNLVLRETPKNIMRLILEGNLDCGMVSLFEYFENQDRLDLVESATIHAFRATMSTLLVTRKSGIVSPMRIAVTEHTRTTAVYLELVLKKLNIDYSLIWSSSRDADSLLKEAEYALVIGDEALRVYSTDLKIVWDLGYQFNLLFSMMPVFSVTVKGKGKECGKEIEILDRAITDSKDHIQEAITADSEKLGLSKEILRRYFNTIGFEFNNEVRRTMDFLSRYFTQGRNLEIGTISPRKS